MIVVAGYRSYHTFVKKGNLELRWDDGGRLSPPSIHYSGVV